MNQYQRITVLFLVCALVTALLLVLIVVVGEIIKYEIGVIP